MDRKNLIWRFYWYSCEYWTHEEFFSRLGYHTLNTFCLNLKWILSFVHGWDFWQHVWQHWTFNILCDYGFEFGFWSRWDSVYLAKLIPKDHARFKLWKKIRIQKRKINHHHISIIICLNLIKIFRWQLKPSKLFSKFMWYLLFVCTT